MSVTAATLINTIRDLIPDPVYDASGTALPDTDGQLVRAQSLYRFLTDGLRATAQKTGWVLSDWTAFNAITFQPTYNVDELWQTIDEVWAKGWRLGYADEGYLVWPNKVEAGQPVVYGAHQNVTQWNLRIYPAPGIGDADDSDTLVGAIFSNTTSLTLSDSSAFQPYGYIRIDNELIQYNANAELGANILSRLIRGCGGTTAASHANGAAVQFCSIAVKGERLPAQVSNSASVIELPLSYHYPLQLYVLARVRQAENEFAEAGRLMQQFDQECQQRMIDPRLKQHQGLQARAYGDASWGPLAWGRVIVP